MGFGAVFATLAFVIIVGLSTYMFVTGTLYTMNTLSESLYARTEIEDSQLRTGIELGDVSVTDNCTLINLAVNNTGATKLLKSDFVHIDVFVYYHCDLSGNNTTIIYKWLPFRAGEPNDNEWTVVNITPDLINPGTFNPDETMNIRIRIYPPITKGSVNWLKVVMPNAVSDANYFQS